MYVLAALADPVRREIVELLATGEMGAGEIAERFPVTRPAVSRHLRVLREAKLVAEQPHPDDARVRVYQLNPEPFSDLHHWLDEIESFWTDQLQAFKRHAESTRGMKRRRGR